MSYAGVETDREHYERRYRELDATADRSRLESDPEYQAEQTKKKRIEDLSWAQRELEFHRNKVIELRRTVKRLERKAPKA